jgi:hypothetical protein
MSGQIFFLNQLTSGISRTAVAAEPLSGCEYRAILISGLYTNLLGRSGSSAEVAGWVAASETDEQVINAFLATGKYFLRTYSYP